jgi:flavin-binding protein dodecin
MMSASKQVKLVGTVQSLIAGITDALRTATIDHSKVFEVMAPLSAITDTTSGKRL